MKNALIAIGGAVLKVIGLNPQHIAGHSEGRVVGKPTFAGMDYQLTGLGERITSINVMTYPHVIGGMDCYAILRAQHEAQAAVNLIRLGRNYAATLEGLVVIRTLESDETQIHPFTGIGRRVEASIELVHVGGLR